MPSSQGKRNRLRGGRSRIERALILRILDYAPGTGNAFPYISVPLSSGLGGLSPLAWPLYPRQELAWGNGQGALRVRRAAPCAKYPAPRRYGIAVSMGDRIRHPPDMTRKRGVVTAPSLLLLQLQRLRQGADQIAGSEGDA